jgi:glycosyltransferase involved in cell wall biosynthesis
MDKKMKVLHIIPTYLPAYNRGGPIWSVHNINKSLVAKGADVTVYTTNIDVEGKVLTDHPVDVDGVSVHYFRASYPRIWEYYKVFFVPVFWPRRWEYSKDLHEKLAKTAKDFDLIHITSTFLFASTLGTYYAKKYRKPSIISPRGNLMKPLELKSAIKKQLYIKLFERRNLTRADAIHFTVPKEKEEYLSYHLPLKKSIIIPNALDLSKFPEEPDASCRKKFKSAERKRIVLFLGRISWKKGLDTLIPAFKEVIAREPDTILVIAGGDDEGYKKKVDALIETHKLKKHIIFTGMVEGSDKFSLYKESDVFVLPSYSENFGMSVVEAMYYELPVVVTDEVGVANYVKEAGAGLIIKKETSALANAIIKILKNPHTKEKMGQAGKKLVKDTFESDKIIEQWVECYEELCKKKL